MRVKTPKLEHVRYVKIRGSTGITIYPYFNTGEKKPNGRPNYIPMPPLSSVDFFDVYAAMCGARDKRQKVEYTITNLADEYESSKEHKGKSKSTIRTYGYMLSDIRETLGDFPVNDLKRGDVQAVLDHDISGPGAHNMFLSVLGVMYTWARDREMTTLEPTKGIKRMDSEDYPPWPEHVAEAGIAADDANVRLVVRLLHFTGQRIGDVLKMRWTDISADGVITITQQKTGKTVWVPLLSELREELERTPKRGFTIVTEPDGSPRSDVHVRAELQAFTAALGHETVPHGLRKNAVISLLEAECSVAETSSITGQSYEIVEHYAKQINNKRMAVAAILKLENKRGTRKDTRKSGSK